MAGVEYVILMASPLRVPICSDAVERDVSGAAEGRIRLTILTAGIERP